MNNYMKKIDELLEKNMTKNCFSLWKLYKEKIPDIWNRPASSTSKYHKKENDYVPTLAEHTYEMLFAFVEVLPAFTVPISSHCDSILLSIILHDACKYGEGEESTNPKRRPYTNRAHDKMIAEKIQRAQTNFLKVLNKKDFEVLVEAIRYHNGRWSVPKKERDEFNFCNYQPETLILHLLDMLSSRNVLKTK